MPEYILAGVRYYSSLSVILWLTDIAVAALLHDALAVGVKKITPTTHFREKLLKK